MRRFGEEWLLPYQEAQKAGVTCADTKRKEKQR
jgi:hypothetical protein